MRGGRVRVPPYRLAGSHLETAGSTLSCVFSWASPFCAVVKVPYIVLFVTRKVVNMGPRVAIYVVVFADMGAGYHLPGISHSVRKCNDWFDIFI